MHFRRINCPFQKFWTIVLTDNTFANIKRLCSYFEVMRLQCEQMGRFTVFRYTIPG